MKQLTKVMGLNKWYIQKYGWKYGCEYSIMDKYKEWLDYRSQKLANNRTEKMYYEFAMSYPRSIDRMIEQTKDIISLEQIKLKALEKAKTDSSNKE